jgi:GNAT superfamily N-acetyltransferase
MGRECNYDQVVEIRDFEDADWPRIWPIMREIAQAAETYCYEPEMPADAGYQAWVVHAPGRTTVAVDGERIVGTAHMEANRPGPGSHVSTASFMVAAGTRGQGLGTALVVDTLRWARERGFAGMQFNAVVETNTSAVELYQRYGFEIIGRAPGAFRHPAKGRVDLLMMYCDFARTPPP